MKPISGGTTGSERYDLQIQQIRTTQKTVRNKKLYSRKVKYKNKDL